MFSLFNWSLRDGNRRTFLLYFFFESCRHCTFHSIYCTHKESLVQINGQLLFHGFFELFPTSLFQSVSFSHTQSHSVSFSFCLFLILPVSHSVFFDFVVLPCNLTFRSNFCVSFAVLLGRFEIHLIGN